MEPVTIIAIGLDQPTERRIAKHAGRPAVAASLGSLDGLDEPDAIVIDLAVAGAVEAAADIRTRWPRTLIAGALSTPDRERWEQAESSGYDLVATRGALPAALARALQTWAGPRSRTRVRLFDLADAAGRLGLVYTSDDTPVGPLAVYQIGSTLHAVEDACPHAGAILSDGPLESGVVTCPLHGSRFDVTSGERVRGPSDRGLARFELATEGGAVFLVLP